MMAIKPQHAVETAGCLREVARGIAGRNWRRVAVAILTGWVSVSACAAVVRAPDQPLRIPLGPLGYQTMAGDFLLAGSSMLTVDFVDKGHLLVTFGVRRLMKRDADMQVDDDDRTVGAFLVELPSGKVLAQTEWRLHDRGQYLWNLGGGCFLLRVRDRLTTIATMAGADMSDAFREVPLLRIDRHIVAILVSSNHDLLTMETTKWAMGAGDASAGFSAEPAPVQISFFRLVHEDEGIQRLVLKAAGMVHARTAIAVPMTTAGVLDVVVDGKDQWAFNFHDYTGKVRELSGYATSCFPHPTFVDHGEFVAFGCRGSDDKQQLAGFNLKGDEMWQQGIDAYVSPTFSFAPAAGRFALERTIVTGAFDSDTPLPTTSVTGEEVRVYQNYTGKQVFKIDCSPVERAGQNFALSPDGLLLAVVRETMVHHAGTKDFAAYTQNEAGVEVYSLPALTEADQAAVKQAEAMAPADVGVRIDLALQPGGAQGAEDVAGDSVAPAATAPDAASGAAAETSPAATPATQGSSTVSEGDAQPGAAPRKPPTLYGPHEKPPQ